MRAIPTPASLFVALSLSPALLAATTDSLPIREVTAFKDGHALVVRAGKADVNPAGDVTLTNLPRPVLGTFWADSQQHGARLASVTSASVPKDASRKAANMDDLLRANIGKPLTLRMKDDTVLSGTLVDLLTDVGVAEAPTDPWGRPLPVAPTRARTLLIRGQGAASAVALTSVDEVRFEGESWSQELIEHSTEERMTFDLDWTGPAAESADVSLMYLQRGVRWIPSYRITMLDDAQVRIELQATLINELADLDNVAIHLAVGVPTFPFKETPDPMALREQADALGLYFREPSSSRTANMFSNAIQSQVAFSPVERGESSTTPPAAPALSGSEQAEDLYVFSVQGVSLAKGARMVLPLATYQAKYEHVYTLDLPPHPPAHALRNFDANQTRKLAALLDHPVVRHVLRITNDNPSRYPITTAPALIVSRDRVLAQGMTTYTTAGSKLDLDIGSAIDLGVQVREVETGRTSDGAKWDGQSLARIDIAFQADIENRKPTPVRLEVRKIAFGLPDTVGQDGNAVAINTFAAEAEWSFADEPWWNYYSWPYYWHRLNGASRFTWTLEVAPGKTTTLDAAWHYFWN